MSKQQHTGNFKVMVALEAICGELTVEEIALKPQVPPAGTSLEIGKLRFYRIHPSYLSQGHRGLKETMKEEGL